MNAIATCEDPREEYFFGCGEDNWEDRDRNGLLVRTDHEAWVFRINDNGEMHWGLKLSGRRPKFRSSSSDICTGMQYDVGTHNIAALIQTNSKNWRLGLKIDDFYDSMIMIVTY